MKNKKLIDCIKEMDWSNNNFVKEVKSSNTILSKQPKNITFDNIVSDDLNWNNEYEYLCVYDFEVSTHYEGGHEAYMICYIIMKYLRKIYNDKEMNDFNKNYKIETLYGKDCAKQFLETLPDKCLCYVHNVRYDISFLTNEDTSIKGCENNTTIFKNNRL